MIVLQFADGAGDLRRPMPARLIETRDDLETPVIISLFTDARDDLRPVDDRRGWWAGPVGSLLWTLFPSKETEETRALAEQYAAAALAWMTEARVAQTVEVTAAYGAAGVLGVRIEITKPDGTRATYAYDLNWAAQAARGATLGVE